MSDVNDNRCLMSAGKISRNKKRVQPAHHISTCEAVGDSLLEYFLMTCVYIYYDDDLVLIKQS